MTVRPPEMIHPSLWDRLTTFTLPFSMDAWGAIVLMALASGLLSHLAAEIADYDSFSPLRLIGLRGSGGNLKHQVAIGLTWHETTWHG